MDPEEGARALRAYVASDLVPAWLSRGVAPDGSFHERLDAVHQAKDLGYQRLLSQCRQVFSFGEAVRLGAPGSSAERARAGFAAMREGFRDPAAGAWRFARGVGAALPNSTRHLYAYAFVVLACSTVERLAPGGEARAIGGETLAALREAFARPGGGYHAAIGADGAPLSLPFQQNPHMHLFEACVFRLEVGRDSVAEAIIGELVGLLLERFLDRRDGTLMEYPEWEASGDDRGRTREPGHHFEWVWLIARWLRLAEALEVKTRHFELENAAVGLLSWAVRQSNAHPEGALWDEVDASGQVLKASHRIWPVLEAVKGLAFARAAGWRIAGAEEAESRLWEILFARYLERGSGRWTEVLDAALRPAVTDHPATTIYHIIMAARELRWLESMRGPADSGR